MGRNKRRKFFLFENKIEKRKGNIVSSAYANFSIVILYTGEMNRDGAMCRYVKTLSLKKADVDKVYHVYDELSYLCGVDR